MDPKASLRQLPQVERVLAHLDAEGYLLRYPRALVVACVREVLEKKRQILMREDLPTVDVSIEAILREARALIGRKSLPSLRRVINATGVILHTNLGRAPLSEAARRAVAEMSSYSTLEVGLEGRGRGSRHAHIESLLLQVTGAEAGFAVNNNAAAVLLVLTALAQGKEVVVSRGELVEIGGTFRMPDVMAASGAKLVEVGTTNKTYVWDYERAITSQTALLLKVHRSNFTLRGFVHETALPELVQLGRRAGIPVMYDLGSGALLDLGRRGLPQEPTVGEAVKAGVDVVTFSGDKLLGGPQAGLIVGRKEVLRRIQSHPLARALRIDKLNLAALVATLRHYLDPERAWQEVPVLRMLSAPQEELERRARQLCGRLEEILRGTAETTVVETAAEAGGGSLPEAHLPSYAVAIRPLTEPVEKWDQRLRSLPLPLIGVIREDALLLDVRTLLPGEEEEVVEVFRTLLTPDTREIIT
ncbi:MAG: L-seryl-tRNA(Sec) selenium transferase [Armatimonadota bacterium]|nr:L-seryl-tRNA(Sec) selenium transferase [Armatimonadota bacterium]